MVRRSNSISYLIENILFLKTFKDKCRLYLLQAAACTPLLEFLRGKPCKTFTGMDGALFMFNASKILSYFSLTLNSNTSCLVLLLHISILAIYMLLYYFKMNARETPLQSQIYL